MRGDIKAGRKLDKNRLYPEEFVGRLKHRYLTYKVLGYWRCRGDIMTLLAGEFGIDRGKVHALLQYEGVFKRWPTERSQA